MDVGFLQSLCLLQKQRRPRACKYREYFNVSTIVPMKSSAPAEVDLLGIQARELSTDIATLAGVILGSGLLSSDPHTTLHEARALDLLGRKPLWCMTEFAKVLAVTLSSASHTADKLVRKRVVKRGRSQQDRRLVLISLSGRGLKRHDALFLNRVRICTAILDQLTPAEREIAVSTIRRLAGLGQNRASSQRIESE